MSGAAMYYPPRADRYSRIRYRLRKLLLLGRRLSPTTVSLREIALSLVIPGFSFRAYGLVIGNLVIAAYAVCALLFFIWIGYPAGMWAFAGMLSIHVSSVAFIVKRLTPDFTVRLR